MKTILFSISFSFLIISCSNFNAEDEVVDNYSYFIEELKKNDMDPKLLNITNPEELRSKSKAEIDMMVYSIFESGKKYKLNIKSRTVRNRLEDQLLDNLKSQNTNTDKAHDCFMELKDINKLREEKTLDNFYKSYYKILVKYQQLFDKDDIDSIRIILKSNSISVD